MRKIDLKSVVWKEGKYYVSQCLEVDVSSFGRTKKEALGMLEDALSLYFEDIPLGTFRSILRQSKLQESDFNE